MLWSVARVVLLCAVMLLTTGGAGAQETSVAATAPDQSVLAAIESQVASIRGLQPLNEVNLQVLDQAALNQYLQESFDRDYLPHEREADQKSMVALGLLQPNRGPGSDQTRSVQRAGHRRLRPG